MTLCLSFFATAHNGDPVNTEPNSSATIILNNIFISDYEGEALFIDFEAVADLIVTLNIIKDKEIMMGDDVQDLPGNTIYEINLDIMRAGTYTVELVTREGISIQKELIID